MTMTSLRMLAVIAMTAWAWTQATAQASVQMPADSTEVNGDAAVMAIDEMPADSAAVDMQPATPAITADEQLPEKGARSRRRRAGLPVDTEPDTVLTLKPKRTERDWATWRPDPQRALWLAMVLPGAGQIYNRKYWKLPIFYGGMMGCLYAMNWNNMMYKDYSQAYLDIMDDDPTTQSYNKFLHLGRQIDSSNEERYKKLFKSRKDRYRRWRDMSFFCLIGVYALSVIDAYVDAELSEFDISNDLSLRIEPAVINSNATGGGRITDASALGLQCSLRF